MAQTTEVIKEQQSGITPKGASITKQKTQIISPEAEEEVQIWTAQRIVYYIAGVIETLLVFRFALKVLGANPASPFAVFIYSLSGIFEAPFRGIFGSGVFQGAEPTLSVLEPSTLLALLVYLVLAIGIVSSEMKERKKLFEKVFVESLTPELRNYFQKDGKNI